MNEIFYDSSSLDEVVIALEHAITGSTNVNVGGSGGVFIESWEEERIDTGDIVLMLSSMF